MSQLSAGTSEIKAAITLKAAVSLDHAPSYPTLKRWAKAGVLNAAKVAVPGMKWVKYDPAALKRLFAAQALAKPEPELVLGQADEKQLRLIESAVSKAMAEKVEPFIARITSALEEADRQFANMEATRKTLMLSMDSQLQAAKLRAATAEQRAHEGAQTTAHLQRLTAAVHHLEAAVKSMTGKVT